jgi:NAD(P)H-dependent FMN reductase
MEPTRILVFAGSARRASWNKKLARAAARSAEEAGAAVTLLDLAEYPMPLYEGDLEEREGLPERARAFKQVLADHPGWILACPEYNSSITPLLKNSIDWATRSEEGKGTLAVFQGKVAGLVSTSPGALGGLRGLVTVRSILSNIGVLVVPEQVAVPKAPEAFTEDGQLVDPKHAKQIDGVVRRVIEVAGRLRG